MVPYRCITGISTSRACVRIVSYYLTGYKYNYNVQRQGRFWSLLIFILSKTGRPHENLLWHFSKFASDLVVRFVSFGIVPYGTIS